MKVSKVFGCVLGLHFGVITVLLVQPGCRSQQPPTFTQERTGSTMQTPTSTPMRNSVQGASRTSSGLIEATRGGATGTSGGQGLDPAFNAGFDDGRFAPATSGDFSEFDDVAPIAPLTSLSSGGQTVQVSGASLETYTIKKGDNLWSIAKRYNVSLDELYAANGLSKSSVLRIGQQIQIPVEGGTAAVNTVSADTYQPSSFNQSSTNYTVKRGDSLSRIANQFDSSVRAIKAANGLSSDVIRVGDVLIVPVGANAPAASPAAGTGTAASTAALNTTSGFTASSARLSNSGARTHTVKSGEFPATIARQYGMTTGELLALNGITDPRRLQVGQVLQVSGSGSAANVDSRTETVVSPSAALIPATRAPAQTTFTTPRTTSTTTTANTGAPVQIRIVEADPLIEGELTEIQSDEMFDGAVEIPVIRLEE